MNIAFIERRLDTNIVSPQHTAVDGLRQLGYETIWFSQEDFEKKNVPITRDTLVVGYIATYLEALRRLDIETPANVDIPDELLTFTGRKIWTSTLRKVRDDKSWPVFVKPLNDRKAFAGRVFSRFRDLFSSSALSPDFPVLCSEVVKFEAEFRCFILYGKVVGVRPYKGNPLIFPRGPTIQAMADAWKSAPAACCIDVGITDDGRTLLVEVNDGHSMGEYGLQSMLYARMIEARWCELTGAKPIP